MDGAIQIEDLETLGIQIHITTIIILIAMVRPTWDTALRLVDTEEEDFQVESVMAVSVMEADHLPESILVLDLRLRQRQCPTQEALTTVQEEQTLLLVR